MRRGKTVTTRFGKVRLYLINEYKGWKKYKVAGSSGDIRRAAAALDNKYGKRYVIVEDRRARTISLKRRK